MSTSTKIALIVGLGVAAYFVFKRGASLSANVSGENLNVSLGRGNRHRNLINGAPRNYNGATPTTVGSAYGAASTVYYGSRPVHVHDSAGDPSSGM